MGKGKRKSGPRSKSFSMDKDDGPGSAEKIPISTVRPNTNSSSQPPSAGQRKAYEWLYVPGLVLACLLVWYQTVNVPFHFDDIPAVVDNLSIRKLENCYGHFKGFFSRGLLQIGFTLNYAIAKKLPDGRPLPESFHVVNLLLHLINTSLAFVLARLVIRRAYGTTGGTLAASAVALVFAVLPIHTMTVNLIASRAVMQSATFSLLFLILAILSLDPERPLLQRIGLTAGTLAALLCSVASKAVGIGAVGLFGLIAYVMGKRAGKISFTRRKLLYLGVSLALCGAVLVGLVRSRMVWTGRYHGVWANLLTQAGVTLQYLKLMVWPLGLSVEHDVSVAHTLWDPRVVLSVAVVLGLLVIGGWLLLRGSLLGLCILWYFVALAPSSSLIPRTETMLEYRAYLAALGFAGALVWLLHKLQGWLGAGRQGLVRWRTTWVWLLGGVWVIGMAVVTFQRNEIYTDPVRLWANAVKNAPRKARPYLSLGSALVGKGRLEEAMDQYYKALQIEPNYAEVQYNLGLTLNRKGRLEEAISHYLEAIRINPRFAVAHNNLGVALEKEGRLDEAMGHYGEALRIQPNFASAHLNMGVALEKQGRLVEAVSHYDEALRIEPHWAKAHCNLAGALVRQERLEEAISHYYEALRIDPDDWQSHFNLGVVLTHQGKRKEAALHFKEVLRLEPQNEGARRALELLSK